MIKRIFEHVVLLLNGVALSLVGLALVDFLLHPLAGDEVFHSALFRVFVVLGLIPLTLAVGFLVIRRVPGNIVGPLLILWSGTVAYFSIRDDINPALFALFFYYDMVIGWLSLFLMVLHFPTGRIHPPAAAAWIYLQSGVFFVLTNLLFLGSAAFPPEYQIANPFHLPALLTLRGPIERWAVLSLTPFLLFVLVSPVLRYRKGSLIEQQQIKWLALFAGSTVLYTLLGLSAIPLLTGGEVMNPGTGLPGMFFYVTAGLFPPLTIGFAVLRYRLWDIDLIIRRTLVYSILTVTLTFVYFVSVVSLQALSQQITKQSESSFATVLSTLGIIAIFTPLRRRIQERVDMRFYRRKYNAEKVLEALSLTLRDEVDLVRLTDSVLAAVSESMHPAHVSFWLRDYDRRPED
jgi:hypothetical protein